MERTVECKSAEGLTVGLIDSIITAATIADQRIEASLETADGLEDGVGEAVDDLFWNESLRRLIAIGGNRTYEAEAVEALKKALENTIMALDVTPGSSAVMRRAIEEGKVALDAAGGGTCFYPKKQSTDR